MATVIRPNSNKILMANMLKVLSGIILFLILLAVVQFTVGLEVFEEIFLIVGIDSGVAFQWLTVIVITLGVLVLLLEYIATVNTLYEFYDDKMTYYKPLFIVFKSAKNIDYRNISKVSFDKQNFFDSLFNTGSVKLDLSSLGERELKMPFVDLPQESAFQIQEILRAYKLKVQAEYTEKHTISGILEKGGL